MTPSQDSPAPPSPSARHGQVLPLVASPLRMSETPVTYERAPPRLGEHTDEVLGELLGYSADKIRSLRETKAI